MGCGLVYVGSVRQVASGGHARRMYGLSCGVCEVRGGGK